MTSPLQLCVRRTPASGGPVVATQVRVRMPSEIDCIEQTVSLVTRHCLAGTAPNERLRFRLQVALAEALANAVMRGNQVNTLCTQARSESIARVYSINSMAAEKFRCYAD